MRISLKQVYERLKDLKLFDIIVYDFKDVSPFFDYQIIASASNERQAHASIEYIKKIDIDTKHFHIEEDAHSRWVLIDLKDIIIHVMHKDTRNDYQIEKLFFDRIKIDEKEIENGV